MIDEKIIDKKLQEKYKELVETDNLLPIKISDFYMKKIILIILAGLTLFTVYNRAEENETIKALKEEYDVQTLSLNSLSTLSAEDRKDKKDYVSIMMDNINSIKLEVNN